MVEKEELQAKQKDLQARLNWLIGRSIAEWNYSKNPLAIITDPTDSIELNVRMNYNIKPIKDVTDPFVPFSVDLKYISKPDELGFLLMTHLLSGITTNNDILQLIGVFAGKKENGKMTVKPNEVLKSIGLVFFIIRQMLLDDVFRKYSFNGKLATFAPDDAIGLVKTGVDNKKTLSMVHDRLLYQAYMLPNFTKDAKYPSPVQIAPDELKPNVAQLEMLMTQELPYAKAYLHVFASLFNASCQLLGMDDSNVDEWIQAGFSQTDDDGMRTFKSEMYFRMATIWHNIVFYSLPSEVKRNFFS